MPPVSPLASIFSADFAARVREGDVMPGIDRSLHALAVAGVAAVLERPVVWIVDAAGPMPAKKTALEGWLRFLGRSEVAVACHPFPFSDPGLGPAVDPAAVAAKVGLVRALLRGGPLVVITDGAGLSMPLERSPGEGGREIAWRVGEPLSRQEATEWTGRMGYEPRDFVEDAGEASWRGNVLDLFPPGDEFPLRIEFAGRRILSMRRFNPATQRSVATLAEAVIPPARYFLTADDWPGFWRTPATERVSLLERLPGARVVASDLTGRWREAEGIRQEWLTRGDALPAESAAGALPPWPVGLSVLDLPGQVEGFEGDLELRTWPAFAATLTGPDLDSLADRCRAGHHLSLCSSDEGLVERLREVLPPFQALPIDIPGGFVNQRTRQIFLAGKRPRPAAVEAPTGLDRERWLEELTPGDPVVHAVHGVGRFVGFSAMTVEGRFAEYLKIEYQNREYLYVPVYELDSLHRYNAPGGGEAAPACDRLGGRSWRQKRDRARKALVHFARELLELYARRKSVPGTSYPRVDEWERVLEESFPYPETPDQREAIARVLDDLEAPCPMDRLVCGDVSFGKTEVAVRAAARVLAAGRQVALLCPTTILALQHFQTFQKRFAGLPVTVRMLSRLVGAGEKTATLKGLRTGGVDLVVGTHALLGTAVEFRDLGLYLIDEEQRFGVFQKERIKQGREHVDVLTLTATPIPRTLSLALAELQDVSLIRTPPLGRRAIRNYVGTLSREVVTTAIQHELDRGGQVFLIYNRIDTIYSFRDRVAEWLPEVPMAVIHAQMAPAVIEKTLLAFIAGRYRVLVSTTLIENGIDIPGVNTLIVAAADRFGLTQLYQLRGRIGRGDRQAHAYFLVEPGKVPSEIAQKRLDAIREFTELGAGFRLAEFDLQLRGAGSLLGARQHGHIEALGFDYYLDLLKQAIHELQGRAGEEIPAAVTVRFAAALDPSLIPLERERIRIYRQILAAQDGGELDRLWEDLADRLGAIPRELELLFIAGAARVLARRIHLTGGELYEDHFEGRLPERGTGGPQPSLPAGITSPVPGTVVLSYRSYREFAERGAALADWLGGEGETHGILPL